MNELFGEYIKKIRVSKKISLNKLSELSGVSSAHLSRIENNKRGIPSPEIIRNIATALDFPYKMFLEKAGYLDNNLQDDLKEWNLFGQKLLEQGYSLDEIIKSIEKNIKIYSK